MDKGYLKSFLKAAGIRALKTFCQAFVSAIGSTAVLGGVDWPVVMSTAALSALVSFVMSFAVGLPEVKLPELPEEDV